MVVVKNEGNDSLRASEEGAFRKGAGGGSRSTNGSGLSIHQQAGEGNVAAGTSTFDKSISPTEAKQAVLNPDGAFRNGRLHSGSGSICCQASRGSSPRLNTTHREQLLVGRQWERQLQ